MKEKNYIPGPARVMYGAYLGSLALVLYSGFYLWHPFSSLTGARVRPCP